MDNDNSPDPERGETPAYDYDSLPDVAKRALAEAEARKRAQAQLTLPKEYGGRDGPEPVRFGDYEKKGIAVDF
ncbi:MAG: DUF1674 domain-containing protein [Pseudomonadota bacterium]